MSVLLDARRRRLAVVVAVAIVGPSAVVAQTQLGPGAAPGGPWTTSEPATPTPAASATRLDARITQVEQDVRAVTGKVEDLTWQMQKLQQKVDRMQSDLELQMKELRTTMVGGVAAGQGPRVLSPEAPASPAPAPTASPPAPASEPAPMAAAAVPPAPPTQQTTPQAPKVPARDQYAYAFSLMQKSDYAGASAAFSDFLKQYPSDPLADNARYWLAESAYARNDYTKAAELFLDAYERGKTGPKAPDALLKLGMSLARIDKSKEACATFRELNRAFPSVSSSIKDRAAQESRRIGCG